MDGPSVAGCHVIGDSTVQNGRISYHSDGHVLHSLTMPLSRAVDIGIDVTLPVEMLPRVRRPTEVRMQQQSQCALVALSQGRCTMLCSGTHLFFIIHPVIFSLPTSHEFQDISPSR